MQTIDTNNAVKYLFHHEVCIIMILRKHRKQPLKRFSLKKFFSKIGKSLKRTREWVFFSKTASWKSRTLQLLSSYTDILPSIFVKFWVNDSRECMSKCPERVEVVERNREILWARQRTSYKIFLYHHKFLTCVRTVICRTLVMHSWNKQKGGGLNMLKMVNTWLWLCFLFWAHLGFVLYLLLSFKN